jgi:plastocyanin
MRASPRDNQGVLAGLLLCLSLSLLAVPVLAATVHVITAENGRFSPENLQVTKGDMVRWEWKTGAYTITSGESLDDETVGEEFDRTLDRTHPSVEVTFDRVGTYPYFSRSAPGVTRGVITVLDATPVNRRTWGFLKKMFENSEPLQRS